MTLLGIAGAVILSAPMFAQGQNPSEASQTTQTASAKPTANRPEGTNPSVKVGKDYVIGADDVLDVSVWKEQELTRTLQVRPDGKISMPLLGDVQAAGLTPGEVARPGAYPVLPGMTVLQAISSAGGLTPFANGKKIFIMRDEHNIQTKYPFSYKDVLDGRKAEQNLRVKAGDTIVVP